MVIATSRNLTILGVSTIVGAVAAVLSALFDGDPATNPDWGLAVSAIVTGVGFILAKGAQSTGGTVTGAGVPVPETKPTQPV